MIINGVSKEISCFIDKHIRDDDYSSEFTLLINVRGNDVFIPIIIKKDRIRINCNTLVSRGIKLELGNYSDKLEIIKP